MADAEILLQGRYRDGKNDEESDRAEDLARLAKQAYEQLRAFEDAGTNPILPEARDLLWWGQAVCVALNAMALRLSEDLGSAVPDGIRIKQDDAGISISLYDESDATEPHTDGCSVLSKGSRVRPNHITARGTNTLCAMFVQVLINEDLELLNLTVSKICCPHDVRNNPDVLFEGRAHVIDGRNVATENMCVVVRREPGMADEHGGITILANHVIT